ncbi:MAG: hypothetical protein KF778_18890 [Rhodocyclaceae bacterium]|nr:hypothetical protein [Rhodocyclaceae bacterium]MBX3670473.1 hypothetical protein [Rhodocyclaceae bacterium]
MAEFTIVLIPEDRYFVPAEGAVAAAKSRIEDYFSCRGYDVETLVSAHPHFVSGNDSFEQLSCPQCGESVMRFDLEEDDDGYTWWDRFEQTLGEAEDAASVSVNMPCCGKDVAVNDIDFGQDAGIARFELSLRDPGDDIEVNDKQKSNLESILGCSLIQIIRVDS